MADSSSRKSRFYAISQLEILDFSPSGGFMSTPAVENMAAPLPDAQDNLDPSTASIEAAAPSDGAVNEGASDASLVAAASSPTPTETSESTTSVASTDASSTAEETLEDSPGQVELSSAQANPANPVDASLEIDHRRAKQLLDRSLLLAERGDFAGAILAARQAVVLTPTSPTGHSMLGLLHERAGDLEKAIASYEKVLELAPSSTLERDSMERLKATLAQENASVIFHFNDNELFEDPEALPPSALPAVKSDVVPPVVPVKAAGVANIPAAVKVQAAQPVAASVTAAPASNAASLNSTPLGAMSPNAAPRRAVSGPPVLAPLPLDYPTPRPPLLQSLKGRPSYYFKAVPLVATTALGLVFMAWAQGISQSKRIAELPVAAPMTPTETVAPKNVLAPKTDTVVVNQTGTGFNPTPPPPGTPVGGGILGDGQTDGTGPKVVVPPPSTGRNPPRAATGTNNSTGTTAAPLPPNSAGPIIPQPVAPSSSQPAPPFAGLAPIRPRSDNSPAVQPISPGSAPSAPVQSAPAPAAPETSGDGGGNSRGGGLFNPGSQPRGVIRVDPVRPTGATAPRPANLVRRSEANAAAAAASGNTGRAISSLSDSIQRLPTGYAYQRRAMAFLDQGDSSRAADDFQAAISAYNDQINRNQDADDARNGIRACQSGLRMAINSIRR